MIEREYTILAPEGMHARPATAMVKLARKYTAAIVISAGDREGRLTSLLNILSMHIKGGSIITLTFDGADEAAAAAAFDDFFSQHLKDW